MDFLGKRLVRAVLSEQDLAKLSEAGVDEHDISDEARDALLWATDFLKANGKWPTVNQLEENTKIELPDVPDDLGYICDLVRKRSLGKSVDSRMKTVLKRLEERDPDEALRLMGEASATLRPLHAGKARVVSFRERGPERFQEYLDLKNIGTARDKIKCLIYTEWEEMLYGGETDLEVNQICRFNFPEGLIKMPSIDAIVTISGQHLEDEVWITDDIKSH